MDCSLQRVNFPISSNILLFLAFLSCIICVSHLNILGLFQSFTTWACLIILFISGFFITVKYLIALKLLYYWILRLILLWLNLITLNLLLTFIHSRSSTFWWLFFSRFFLIYHLIIVNINYFWHFFTWLKFLSNYIRLLLNWRLWSHSHILHLFLLYYLYLWWIIMHSLWLICINFSQIILHKCLLLRLLLSSSSWSRLCENTVISWSRLGIVYSSSWFILSDHLFV